jgi:lysosomal acid lipase/cholesteryl ester hydrolase
LAKQGFDVWIVNHRGTTNSKGHLQFKEDSSDYWDFSFHEEAIYDLPSIIDYILLHTGYSKIGYLGHSLGGMLIFYAMAENPKYFKEKLSLIVSMAPAFSFNNSAAPILKTLLKKFKQINFLLDKFGIKEVLPLMKWSE